MAVQEHEGRAVAAVPHTQRCLSDIDEVEGKAVEEAHAEGLP
jgi:hypothetical protein